MLITNIKKAKIPGTIPGDEERAWPWARTGNVIL
jgi:hypothetical protein